MERSLRQSQLISFQDTVKQPAVEVEVGQVLEMLKLKVQMKKTGEVEPEMMLEQLMFLKRFVEVVGEHHQESVISLATGICWTFVLWTALVLAVVVQLGELAEELMDVPVWLPTSLAVYPLNFHFVDTLSVSHHLLVVEVSSFGTVHDHSETMVSAELVAVEVESVLSLELKLAVVEAEEEEPKMWHHDEKMKMMRQSMAFFLQQLELEQEEVLVELMRRLEGVLY